MRVTGNVKSHWGKFYSKINCHVPCRRGKLQKKEAQYEKKIRIPNDNEESGS